MTRRTWTAISAWLALSAGWASAQALDVPGATPQRCDTIAQLAGAMMEARQSAVPLQDLIVPGAQSFEHKISNQLALDAYEAPRFSQPSAQRQVIQDFADDALRHCLRQANR